MSDPHHDEHESADPVEAAAAAGAPGEEGLREIVQRVRRGGEVRPLVTFAFSLITAAILGGAAIGVAWTVGIVMRKTPLPGGVAVGDVRDEDVVLGLIIAGVIWLVGLIWIWRPVVRLHRHALGPQERQRWAVPLVATAVLIGGLVMAGNALALMRYDDTEYATTAIAMIGGGIVGLLWLPLLFRVEQGRAVHGRGGVVNVYCPKCGYALAGLREATCPECGAQYTLDELIEKQGYGVETDHR